MTSTTTETAMRGTASAAPVPRAEHGDDPAWSRIARNAGWICGIALLLASAAMLVDAVGLLGSAPGFTSTGGGELQDQASFFRGLFAHQRQILPDIVVRTVLFLVAYLALVPFGLALRRLLGRAAAETQLASQLIVIGGVLAGVAQLVTLVQVETWRGDWTATEPQVLLSYATAGGTMDALNTWLSLGGLLFLGVGLIYAGRRLHGAGSVPRWLGLGAYAMAAAVLLLVAIDVAGDIGLGGTDIAHNVIALPLGIAVAPAVLIGLARHAGLRRNV